MKHILLLQSMSTQVGVDLVYKTYMYQNVIIIPCETHLSRRVNAS